MTERLTGPISGRLWFALLIITVGAEIDLYLTRYSYLASDLYDAIMVSSFFIGIKLHARLKDPVCSKKTKRQHILQFTGAFLIFFIGSTLINLYSGAVFTSFNNNYNQAVQSHIQVQPASGGNHADSGSALVGELDDIGYDLFTDGLAGLEEVWRLAYMIMVLVICRKLFRRRWESGMRDVFLLLSLFISSILFGVDHTLDASQSWPVKIGAIVTFANMGLLLGLILLWTRSLWIPVAIHSLYDISAYISSYFFDYAILVIAAIVLAIHVILVWQERRKERKMMFKKTFNNIHSLNR